ncbi:MAG: hypothetical protein C0623_11825 [Desulfuromonas sp.]|nr:MAG: hypothetical protein C0623_11825 [Desulfuromonas sp.]
MVRLHDIVAIFHSIHKVMKAEKELKRKRFTILLIPVPRQLTSDCGLAIRYAESDRQEIEAFLNEQGLPPEELYLKTEEGFDLLETGE